MVILCANVFTDAARIRHPHGADAGPMRRPDLNILVILCAVYREGSVTRAAERLNLTQSAISHGLGRLRLLFDDPLFVRKGNRLISTPLARSLAEDAAEGLRDVFVGQAGGFLDPFFESWV